MELRHSEISSQKNYKCLSGSTLKIIAIVLMLIDHIGAVVLYHGYIIPHIPFSPGTAPYNVYTLYRVLRFIGRSALPIFCFLLIEGFLHTSDRQKYGTRLLFFALLSEIPFDLAVHNSLWDLSSQNIFFTLFIGFCVLWLLDILQENLSLQLLSICCGMLLAHFLKTDYGYWGILLITALYWFRNRPGLQTLAGSVCLFWEAPACLAFIPINLYNGKRGISLKYFFYLFYAVHLLLLTLLRYLLFPLQS